MKLLTVAFTAIFLALLSNQANATRVAIDNFCGDKYCGQSATPDIKIRGHKLKRIAVHKGKTVRRVQVASIGPEPIQEAHSVSGLVSQAEQYLGQTAAQLGVRRSLWCSAFIRKLTGASGVDDRAISWLSKPRASSGCIGCLGVLRHHIGIVKGYDNAGNPILISGNHGHRVGIGKYSKNRILAYVSP